MEIKQRRYEKVTTAKTNVRIQRSISSSSFVSGLRLAQQHHTDLILLKEDAVY